MSTTNKKEFPGEFYVYVCDRDNGDPIFAVTTDADEVDGGELIGIYTRKEVKTVKVTRELV